MNKKIKEGLNLFLLLALVISSVALFSFADLSQLKGLLYPKEITFSSSGDDYGNTLQVAAYVNQNGKNKNYRFEDISISINQINLPELHSKPSSGISGNTPYSITRKEEIRDVVLQAPSSHFVGWSGCDANTDNRCQVSVTDHQTRKIEAHYSIPEPDLPLQLWSVSNNELSGKIGEDLPNLINPAIAFKAANNNLTGNLPSSIGDLDSLQISLGRNSISGSIPTEIGDLSSIEYLALYRNSLSGSIPSELGDLTSLKYLLLYDNNLSGSIPSELGDLTSLKRFELHDNKLSGSVPAELANLQSLTPNELRLYNNKLTSTGSGLMSDSSWQGINFHSNNFNAGAIKSALGEASSRSGNYIDFCGNAAVVHASYSKDGSTCTLDIPSQVNAAADKWGEIYVEATLTQAIEYYPGTCSGNCSGSIRTKEVCDDDGNCRDREYCSTSDSCGPDINGGSVSPPPGGYPAKYCIKITEAVNSCEDLDPIPDEVNHVAEFNNCKIWTHPQCEPVCESSGCGGSTSNCPDDSNYECEATGEFGSGWDSLSNTEDSYQESCN